VHNPVQIIDNQRPDRHVVAIHPTSISTPTTHTEPQASHGRLRHRCRDPRRSRQRAARRGIARSDALNSTALNSACPCASRSPRRDAV
jgi:hypothetical protein